MESDVQQQTKRGSEGERERYTKKFIEKERLFQKGLEEGERKNPKGVSHVDLDGQCDRAAAHRAQVEGACPLAL